MQPFSEQKSLILKEDQTQAIHQDNTGLLSLECLTSVHCVDCAFWAPQANRGANAVFFTGQFADLS